MKDYPITFGYLAKTTVGGVPYIHRGLDRSAPKGTPVVIGNTVIGLVGSTGKSTGNHLHTQSGKDPATQNTVNPINHEFKPGKVTAIRTTDKGDWGKFVTIKGNDGYYTTYAHLSEVNVKVGQVIKEVEVTDRETAIFLHRVMTHVHNTPEKSKKYWTGLSNEQLKKKLKETYESDWFKTHTRRLRAWNEKLEYIKKLETENTALKAKVGSSDELNAFGKALTALLISLGFKKGS